MNGHRINGIVRHEERVAGAGIDVARGDIYAAMLQVHVDIGSDYRITTYPRTFIACVLYGKLLDSRTVVRSVI